MLIELSRGVLIRETKSAKYALSPSNEKEESVGRRSGVPKGKRSRGGRTVSRWNLMEKSSSRVKVARQVTKSLGRVKHFEGIASSLSLTRLLAEEIRGRSVENDIRVKESSRRWGVEPPKNVRGNLGVIGIPAESSR